MYKKFPVILFILATLTVIYCTTLQNSEPDWPPYATEWIFYKIRQKRIWPPIEEWHLYYHLYVPFIIALIFEIPKKIFKNNFIHKLILVLNIILLILSSFWFAIFAMII